jgi:hypothetical protein
MIIVVSFLDSWGVGRVRWRTGFGIQGSPEQVVMPSCQRKLASRIGLTADAFSKTGFRLSPE